MAAQGTVAVRLTVAEQGLELHALVVALTPGSETPEAYRRLHELILDAAGCGAGGIICESLACRQHVREKYAEPVNRWLAAQFREDDPRQLHTLKLYVPGVLPVDLMPSALARLRQAGAILSRRAEWRFHRWATRRHLDLKRGGFGLGIRGVGYPRGKVRVATLDRTWKRCLLDLEVVRRRDIDGSGLVTIEPAANVADEVRKMSRIDTALPPLRASHAQCRAELLELLGTIPIVYTVSAGGYNRALGRPPRF